MTIKPSVPNEWKEYEIRYRYKQSVYNIKVTNENDDSNIYDRKQIVLCNGDKIEDGKIKLQEKGIFNIEVVCKQKNKIYDKMLSKGASLLLKVEIKIIYSSFICNSNSNVILQ